MFRLITSADRRLAAISNVVRVRVEFSKNTLNTRLAAQQRHLLHLALGHRHELVGGVEDAADHLARAGPRCVSRWRRLPVGRRPAGCLRSSGRFTAARRSLPALVGKHQLLVGRHLDLRRRASRASIGSSRPPRSARIARRTALGRPKSKSSFSAARIVRPGVQHVVHEDRSRARRRERDLAAARFAVQADAAEVVAMQRHGEHARAAWRGRARDAGARRPTRRPCRCPPCPRPRR